MVLKVKNPAFSPAIVNPDTPGPPQAPWGGSRFKKNIKILFFSEVFGAVSKKYAVFFIGPRGLSVACGVALRAVSFVFVSPSRVCH